MATRTLSLAIDKLRVGVTCSHPIEGEGGVLLLEANTRITQQVITGLRELGIQSIEIEARDLAVLRQRGSEDENPVEKSLVEAPQWSQAESVRDLLIDRHDEGLSEDRRERLDASMGMAKEQFHELKTTLATKKIRSVNSLREISDVYADSIVDDHDQTIGVVGAVTESDDLDERSVRMSVLGMAIAIELGLSGQETLEVGMAGLLHDLGLNVMDPSCRRPVDLMTDAERWEYQKHPLVSLACIEDVLDIPSSVQLAIQQVHEQFDGSGYPRGVKGQRIHSYARILNVVDSYLQLTMETPLRPGILPHDAIGLILHQASRGLYDPKMIRAFLNIETMFPLGSMVELNSGEVAQVIRRPRTGFAAPVLMANDGKRIELETESVKIVRPVGDPELEQMRLTPDVMQESEWHPDNRVAVI